MKTSKETAKRLAESPEMAFYYQVLAVKHSNSMIRVFGRGNGEKIAEKIIERAKKETELLLKTEEIIESADGNLNHNCRPGTIWNEELDRCVPI